MGEAIGGEGEEERGAEPCGGGSAGGRMGVQWGGRWEKQGRCWSGWGRVEGNGVRLEKLGTWKSWGHIGRVGIE